MSSATAVASVKTLRGPAELVVGVDGDADNRVGTQCHEVAKAHFSCPCILLKFRWQLAGLEFTYLRGECHYARAEEGQRMPGAGLFRLTASTQLTRPGGTTSVWQLPPAFAAHAQHLSYHTRASRWTPEADGTLTLRTVGRGQEFVVKADNSLRDWASQLIELSNADKTSNPRMTPPS